MLLLYLIHVILLQILASLSCMNTKSWSINRFLNNLNQSSCFIYGTRKYLEIYEREYITFYIRIQFINIEVSGST